MASGWARQDAPAATRWAIALGDDAARPDAVDAALSYWVLADAPAAVSYVRTLKGGDARDDGLDALSSLLGTTQPDLAVALAADIENPHLRNNALADAYAAWQARDPAAARRWLDAVDLPASARRRLQGD